MTSVLISQRKVFQEDQPCQIYLAETLLFPFCVTAGVPFISHEILQSETIKLYVGAPVYFPRVSCIYHRWSKSYSIYYGCDVTICENQKRPNE